MLILSSEMNNDINIIKRDLNSRGVYQRCMVYFPLDIALSSRKGVSYARGHVKVMVTSNSLSIKALFMELESYVSMV